MTIRWTATVYYRSDAGSVEVTHDFSEMHDLHDLIERGPHWDTIERISIKRFLPILADLTLEQAESL